jgi:hypothetical protein
VLSYTACNAANLTEFELRRLRHEFTEPVTRALQPALWLLILGQVFLRSGVIQMGNIKHRGIKPPESEHSMELSQNPVICWSVVEAPVTSLACLNHATN